MQWVDSGWATSLKKSPDKLWEMYEEVKKGRVNDCLDFMEQKFNLRDEISKMHVDLRRVQDEVEKITEEKQVTLALKAKAEQALIDAKNELEQKKNLDAAASNMHKVMRMKAEKERDNYKEEKKKLEYMIADLLKQKQERRGRVKMIRELCDEYDEL